MPEIPTDPEKKLLYFVNRAAASALASVCDFVAEVQVFQLDQIWEPGTPEYQAVAEALEAVKAVIAEKHHEIAHKAESLLE